MPMPTLIDYLIGAGLGVIGVILGYFYERTTEKWSERKDK